MAAEWLRHIMVWWLLLIKSQACLVEFAEFTRWNWVVVNVRQELLGLVSLSDIEACTLSLIILETEIMGLLICSEMDVSRFSRCR